MLHSKISHWIVRRLGRWRNVGYDATIWPPEAQLAIRVAIDLVALLVDGAMVTATQHDQIGQGGGPAVCPVMDVVALNERQATSWKAAPLVAVQERKTKGRGDRAGPRADFYRAAVDVMAHDHPARIARQALRRLRGNTGGGVHAGLARPPLIRTTTA